MAKPANTGIRRILRATKFSSQGLAAAWKNEAAFRQELLLVVVLLPVAVWLGQTALERAVLIAFLLLVIIVELINSAIEAAIDRHGDELHDDYKQQAGDQYSAFERCLPQPDRNRQQHGDQKRRLDYTFIIADPETISGSAEIEGYWLALGEVVEPFECLVY